MSLYRVGRRADSARFVAVWFIVAMISSIGSSVHAQSGYIPIPPSGPPPDPQGFISVRSPAICTVGDTPASSTLGDGGGFIKVDTPIQIDSVASVAGACELWWAGNWYYTWQRVMLHTLVNSVPPTLPAEGDTVYGSGSSYSQTLDTRVANTTTGPWLTSMAEPGAWQFTFKSVTTSTACNFPAESNIVAKTVHAMTCRPEWFTDEETKTINFHGPATGDIYLGVPPGFPDAIGPAQAAAADWQAALGRPISVLTNHTCSANDPLCIGFSNDHGTIQGDVGCASLGTASYTQAGVWTGSTYIRFHPDWTVAHPDALRRLIAHEIGHYFGLWNRLTCDTNASIMTAFPGSDCYTTQALPQGTNFAPTASDVSAILNSTYGNQVRTTCGW